MGSLRYSLILELRPPIPMDITPLITLLTTRIRMRFGWQDRENGQALIEYSLIMVLVVCVILVTLIVLGNQVRNTYCNIAGAVVNP
jgi:Flp pilus assembly pilin Flp